MADVVVVVVVMLLQCKQASRFDEMTAVGENERKREKEERGNKRETCVLGGGENRVHLAHGGARLYTDCTPIGPPLFSHLVTPARLTRLSVIRRHRVIIPRDGNGGKIPQTVASDER
jgi:hypothetical protein